MNFIDKGTTSDTVNMKSYNYTSVEAKGSCYESCYKNDFNYKSSSACINSSCKHKNIKDKIHNNL